MAQRSASQPTGNQRFFGRIKNNPSLVALAIVGLALAIGLTFFVSRATTDRVTARLTNVDTPVAQFALEFKNDLSEMRRLEESFVLNMGSGNFASNVTRFWQPYFSLNQDAYRNLVVLERALDIGFDGQRSDAVSESLTDLRAAGAAINTIVLSYSQKADASTNSDQQSILDERIAGAQATYQRAMLDIDTNLNSIINLAVTDQNVQETNLERIGLVRNIVIGALVASTLALLYVGLPDGTKKASDDSHNVFQSRLRKKDRATDAAVSNRKQAISSQLAVDRPFLSRIQNQLFVVFLAMVGLALAIGITSILSQTLAQRTASRLINVDTPIAQFALDFKGDISEMRRLEEAYTLDIRGGDLETSTQALLLPWQALRREVDRRTLILERALELGFDGQLADTMQSSQTQIAIAGNSLGSITQDYAAREALFADIEERTETINVLSVLLSFSNEKQEELRDAAQINDLSLTLLSREYLITGELENLNEYEALVNDRFVEGDPISELRVESVRDFRALFDLDQDIAQQRLEYKRSLESVDNNLNNIINLTLSDQTVQEAALSRTNTIAIAIIGALIVATLLPVGIYLMTSGGSTFAQIESLQNTVARIQKGDFRARAEIISRDETQIVATEMNEMLATTFSLIQSGDEQRELQAAIMQLLEDVSDVADGDMTTRAASSHELTIPMAQAFNETVSQLHDLLTEVDATTDEVGTITQSATASTVELTAESESQIGHIIDTTAAVDEMAVSIQHVSRSAARSAEVSQTAQNSARQGSQAVLETISGLTRIQSQTERTLGQIDRLADASQNISHTISLIDDISDQTSVLALNASIRALAAGDDGLGFTVVAREIEDLSTQASQAAQRVQQLTSQIQMNAILATDAMSTTQDKLQANQKVADEAALHLQNLETVTERFSGIINEITMVANQQAANSEVVARSMNEIADTTKQTVSGSHGTIDSLEALSSLTVELGKSIALFKLNSAEIESGAVTA